jgi:hypothetical protein
MAALAATLAAEESARTGQVVRIAKVHQFQLKEVGDG